MSLIAAVLDDYDYEWDDGQKYPLGKDGWFIEKKKKSEVTDEISKFVTDTYVALDKGRKIYGGNCVIIDPVKLDQVLYRYSLDIYGQKRLESQINDLTSSGVTTARREKILHTLRVFGCRVNSTDPYLYRKISNLFYWFSALKPFYLDYTKVDITRVPDNIKNYFNEFTTYALLSKVVALYKEEDEKGKEIHFQLSIHNETDEDDKKTGKKPMPLFTNFLYDLHFRCLSRPSLEFFMRKYCKPV